MLAARFSRTHRPTRAIGACCTARRAAVAELAGMLDDDGVTVERLAEYAGRGYPAGGDCAARDRGGSPTEAAVEQRDAFALEPVPRPRARHRPRGAPRHSLLRCV